MISRAGGGESEGRFGRLTHFIVAYVADDLFEHFQALGSEHVEAGGGCGGGRVGEPGVVFVGEGAGFEAGGI